MQFIPKILRKLICSGVVGHRNIFPVTAKGRNTLYLTFDDGPHPEFTRKVLDLLQRNQVSATFFVNGDKLKKHPEIGSQIVQQGHSLGNHTYSHKVFTKITRDERRYEVCSGQAAVENFQQGKAIFRPPQGMLYFSDLIWLIRNDHTIVMWSIDSHDSFHPPATQIEHRLKQIVRGNNVLLFHDDDNLCVEVLEYMIPWWRSQGFLFSAINPEIV